MTPEQPPILAIESSCDDTAAAVWAGGRLASSVVASQRVHEGWGGVVPELASRAHQRLIVPTVKTALEEAGVPLAEVGAIAVTYGPGLAGSLLVGLSTAKGLALGLGIPLIGVNHLEGHVYSVFVDEPHPAFPFLCLTVSGGHTLLTLVREGFVHEELGRTRDDAAGEAFDKVARLLGLGYPGGPHIDRLAASGDATQFALPSPRITNHKSRSVADFSFSGLKTAVRYTVADAPEAAGMAPDAWLEANRADVAAAFQHAASEALVGALSDAVRQTGVQDVAIVGGVSANSGLRAAAQEASGAEGWTLHMPAMRFSVDNAAMIAVTAAFKWAAGETDDLSLGAEPSLKL
ncbi:tRNA (adenosine(37)-N6)-threonylcarbamoyltransferase complex transferase subunit TsaD [Rubricoccus marinus]|uniref:tRNA N6-adenosine threonylcarbamoyltransferase n=1 Tax=Rubricoccus marinus TaxID=716817 RepID=A0A259TZ14_9BACT|nr:tRNA (adenosine(37)-N6)-threonylcarbamoyltransferase complex transferase subunit TsaD [Rubricoccus marinus]OZC03015.1 tRNA (adenosine(37)-N6)-threonylcarbamoyltransferase complex transferase subunit TsaD [Rubricoccus marinus]